MCQLQCKNQDSAARTATATPCIVGTSKHTTSVAPSDEEEEESQVDWSPYDSCLTLNFGTVGPSAGPWPWVLERKRTWDFSYWLSSSEEGGIHFLGKARIIRLVLSEEFLFDTIDVHDTSTFGAYITTAHAHRSLTPWGDILDTLRSALHTLGKQLDLFEIHVQGLGTMSSMSDYGVGKEQNTPAVLRPTAGVYKEFIDEFTRFRPGKIGEVRLSGLFPGDWASVIERRMPGARCTKDFSEFVQEIRWWTVGFVDLDGLATQSEPELRRRHSEARWAMLNGAGSDHDECNSDPGYESEECLIHDEDFTEPQVNS
ncbi:hypothetical protein V8F20_009535 [Naviculisporaceae sp. PSN 640]